MPTISQAKKTWVLREPALEARQESHHFEVSNDLPLKMFIGETGVNGEKNYIYIFHEFKLLFGILSLPL